VPPNVPSDFGVFWAALKLTQDNFVDTSKLTNQNLTWGAIRGMIDALGDTGHSVFLTPAQLKAEQDSLSGKLTGIGVIVDQRSGAPIVVSVIDGSPAAAGGIRPGDMIIAVDGQPVDRMSVDQVVSAIRGPAGTTSRPESVLRGRRRGHRACPWFFATAGGCYRSSTRRVRQSTTTSIESRLSSRLNRAASPSDRLVPDPRSSECFEEVRCVGFVPRSEKPRPE